MNESRQGVAQNRKAALGRLLVILLLLPLAIAVSPQASSAPATVLATFTVDRSNPASPINVYSWTVPKGIRTVTFQVSGASGTSGDGIDPGGNGGRTTATFSVSRGQIFQIVVGGAPDPNRTYLGLNGGGSGGGLRSGAGGGGSDVRLGPCVADLSCGFSTRIVVAGGGGGGGTGARGGHGGGLSGENGGGASTCSDNGCGGTQEGGGDSTTFCTDHLGAGISRVCEDAEGNFGRGGDVPSETSAGGAGGGGWTGGGAGWGPGKAGGGGSSYISPFAESGFTETGVHVGDGLIVIYGA